MKGSEHPMTTTTSRLRLAALAVALATSAACLPFSPWRPTPRPPIVLPPPDPQPQPQPEPPPPAPDPVRPPTRAEVDDYRGHLANLRDSAGRVIWTPSLPALPAELRAEWLRIYAEAGGTHLPIGPFEPGEIYPGAGFFNPDWQSDPVAIRGLLDEIMATRTLRGHGMVPVIFVDGGGQRPAERLRVTVPTIKAAIHGIEPETVVLPCGWEPHAWTARECFDAIALWQSIPSSPRGPPVLAWHGWPRRSNGASNDPFNPNNDDPWLGPRDPATGAAYGDGATFWRETPFSMFLFQIAPPRTMAEASCGRTVAIVDRDGTPGMGYAEDCWMNHFEDSLSRVGASTCTDGIGRRPRCGWPTRTFVLFETTTYWEYRTTPQWPSGFHVEPGVTALVNRRALELCRSYGVRCGFGTGIPEGLPLLQE